MRSLSKLSGVSIEEAVQRRPAHARSWHRNRRRHVSGRMPSIRDIRVSPRRRGQKDGPFRGSTRTARVPKHRTRTLYCSCSRRARCSRPRLPDPLPRLRRREGGRRLRVHQTTSELIAQWRTQSTERTSCIERGPTGEEIGPITPIEVWVPCPRPQIIRHIIIVPSQSLFHDSHLAHSD